jgi:hypothetical protein
MFCLFRAKKRAFVAQPDQLILLPRRVRAVTLITITSDVEYQTRFSLDNLPLI